MLASGWGLQALAQDAGGPPLALGPADLTQSRADRQLAPGLRYSRICRGRKSSKDYYTIEAAFVRTRSQAESWVKLLAGQKFPVRIEAVHQRAADDHRSGPLGFAVRVGKFPSEAAAVVVRNKLSEKGYTLAPPTDVGERGVMYSGEDGHSTTGPWMVHVLEVDPHQFKGHLASVLATRVVPGVEPLSAIASRVHAEAGMNGGYFVMADSDGTVGDLAGLSIVNGELISEAVPGRACLLLPSDLHQQAAHVAQIWTALSVQTAAGAEHVVDGLNRTPGLVRSIEDGKPRHDTTETKADELIRYTQVFGDETKAGPGAEVVLDAQGVVTEVRPQRGGKIPSEGCVLSGIGEAAAWLTQHAPLGARLQYAARIEAAGQPRHSEDIASAVNGGPRLLRDGEVAIDAAAEGFDWPDKPEFYYRFGVRRNPRSMAGITGDGHILLVTVDGRRPGYSVGLSFNECARLMRSLGARDALNLDGGGSATMVLGTDVANKPSDAAGERPIADALVLTP
jgi:exopolysaccharide biosynthesis protein